MSLNRKIVYIEIDEEINSIFNRIKKIKEKDIFLVVPSKSLLFQSVLNLKILKTKTEALSKSLVLVTKDSHGKNLCKNIGLKSIDSIQKGSDKHEIKIKINSIDAYRNEVVEDQPKRKDFTKISISDLVGKVSDKLKNKKEEIFTDGNIYNYTIGRPNRKGLIAIVVLSITLFFFISYIALPGATIYVKPKSNIIETGINIELTDAKINQKILEENPPYMIPTFPINTVFEKKITFNTISTVFEGKNAKGKLQLINKADQEWTLRSKTRFQTKDGLIFRSKTWVTVPPRKSVDEPGIAYVEIEADEFDIYKQVIGDRGNIPPSKFTIPGLSQYNQKFIWGETTTMIQGGTTKWSKKIQQEDIDVALKKVENELLATAKKDIEEYILRQNQINNVNLILLDNPKYIEKKILEIRVPENIVDKKLDQFEVYAKIEVSAITYDEIKFKQILKSGLLAKVHPDMQIRDINFDNIGYDIIDENKILKILKISVTINGREEYTIDTNTDSGMRFTTKVKTAVIGMSVNDAENLIANLKEVSQVKISTWPFFSSRMPGLSENIDIKLIEED